MVNESRMRDVLEVLEGKEPKAGREWLKGHLSSRTFRLKIKKKLI
jgi:hypothetical protein